VKQLAEQDDTAEVVGVVAASEMSWSRTDMIRVGEPLRDGQRTGAAKCC
jgi:hypothetical protein